MNFLSQRIFSFETLCALLAVLFVILVGNNLISGQQCDAGDPELPFDTREPMKGIKLSGMAPWRTVLVQDLSHCAELCKKRKSCTVYNVGPLDTTGLVRPCELYDGPVLVKEDQTTNNPDWYLGGRQCDVGNDCTNGKECIQFGSRKSPEKKCIPVCPSRSLWEYHQGICYRFVKGDGKEEKWDGARDECLSNGNLVMVKNANINTLLSNIASNQKDSWIGLIRKEDDRTFHWVDGTPVGYTNFASGQHDRSGRSKACVYMRQTDGKWVDDDCNQKMNYICEIPAIKY
ncbi:macrophage mannose receptor 1 [Nematostella vectensis]|uniref:macrophage mannose receptor 1 n=1 Tax=Nematostella vectensis TaxID=45351 RepID=UPI0020771898|nr:macrophage mannose receptor 1 [Nematostella vectensis]